MKSIKPGRGPSAMGAVGSVGVGIFGIIWTIGAASMGAPVFFVMFGIVFVGLAIVQAIFHFKNATGANRMSIYDITDSVEEGDPFDKFIDKSNRQLREIHVEPENETYNYCPYCGNKVTDDSYKFCSKCGKKVRD